MASHIGVLRDGVRHIGMLGVGVHVLEQFHDLLVGGVAHGPEQHGHRALALPVHLDRDHILIAGIELHPGAAVGDQLGGGQGPA